MPAFGVWLKNKLPAKANQFMNEKAYVELIGQILESLGTAIDEVKRCLLLAR